MVFAVLIHSLDSSNTVYLSQFYTFATYTAPETSETNPEASVDDAQLTANIDAGAASNSTSMQAAYSSMSSLSSLATLPKPIMHNVLHRRRKMEAVVMRVVHEQLQFSRTCANAREQLPQTVDFSKHHVGADVDAIDAPNAYSSRSTSVQASQRRAAQLAAMQEQQNQQHALGGRKQHGATHSSTTAGGMAGDTDKALNESGKQDGASSFLGVRRKAASSASSNLQVYMQSGCAVLRASHLPAEERGWLPAARTFVYWRRHLNCCYAIVCDSNDNRALAAQFLGVWMSAMNDFFKGVNVSLHPEELLARPDEALLLLNELLPSGRLLHFSDSMLKKAKQLAAEANYD